MTSPTLAEWLTIREALAAVARPDSRFDLDLESFIPAFEGIARASAKAMADPLFDAADRIFVTPDNSMQPLRREALARGKTLLVPSYGLRRGLLQIGPLTVSPDFALFASWGDGIQYFAEPLALDQIARSGKIDLIVAGAAAVARNGRRFGMGYRYLDVEWNMFRTAGTVDDSTPIWTIVHDCQVLDRDARSETDNLLVDRIFTPSREVRTGAPARPSHLEGETLRALFGDARLNPPIDRYLALTEQ